MYQPEVIFNTGITEADERLNITGAHTSLLSAAFQAYQKSKKLKRGHPVIQPTTLFVSPYENLEGDLSYNIMASVELEDSRMITDETVLTQKWLGGEGYRTLGIVDENQNVVIDNVGPIYQYELIALRAIYDAIHSQDAI